MSRRPAREPDIPKKYRSKGLSDENRSLKMTVVIETEDENSERVWSVLSLIQKMGILKRYLGPQVKILGLGPYGPKPEDLAGQAERCQDLRINMAYLFCTKSVILGGLLKPNKWFFAKRANGSYWTTEGKQTTINLEFQNLRVDTGEAGTGQPPFSCAVPFLAGPKEGNSALVYWDDSVNAPPPRKGVKRTKDGEISTLVNNFKGDKAPYWFSLPRQEST